MSRLIDADALKAKLQEAWNVCDDQDFCDKEVWRILEEQPTAQKTGQWIEHEVEDAIRWNECSVCRYEVPHIDMNYCPNCGSLNRSEGEEDE